VCSYEDMIQPATSEAACTVRATTFEDFETISQVACRNGLGSPTYSDWARLWKDNPFRSKLQLPMGWVLETEAQGVVGTFSNIPRLYSYNDEPVRTATASAWAVDPQYRYSSLLLVTEFFSQKNIDLFLNTTASPRAAAIFKAFRSQEIPHPSYKQVLFWVTCKAGFAGALLRKLQLPALGGLKQAAVLALWCRDELHRSRIRYRRLETCVVPGFDERFDAMWDVLRRRRDRLLAVRTRDALTWHFRPSLEAGHAVVIVLPEGNSISGYLIMKRYDHRHLGLSSFGIVDIQAAREEPDIILSLVAGALEHAARSGVHVVEAVGFHNSKREVLERLKPLHWTHPSCPCLYKVGAGPRTFRDALRTANAWDPSRFDGDASL
jgi:hypothetical protein